MGRYSIFILAVVAFACSKHEVKEPLEYKGPLREVEKMEMFYSEKDLVKIKMLADLVYEFQSGDREFPKGIYIEFYDETGRLESTIRADHAYYFKEQDQWRGRGKVEVKNIAKDEQLNTEELFWKPTDKQIFTEKFVTIHRQEDIIYGTGLTASQDLSDYTITNASGVVGINE